MDDKKRKLIISEYVSGKLVSQDELDLALDEIGEKPEYTALVLEKMGLSVEDINDCIVFIQNLEEFAECSEDEREQRFPELCNHKEKCPTCRMEYEAFLRSMENTHYKQKLQKEEEQAQGGRSDVLPLVNIEVIVDEEENLFLTSHKGNVYFLGNDLLHKNQYAKAMGSTRKPQDQQDAEVLTFELSEKKSRETLTSSDQKRRLTFQFFIEALPENKVQVFIDAKGEAQEKIEQNKISLEIWDTEEKCLELSGNLASILADPIQLNPGSWIFKFFIMTPRGKEALLDNSLIVKSDKIKPGVADEQPRNRIHEDKDRVIGDSLDLELEPGGKIPEESFIDVDLHIHTNYSGGVGLDYEKICNYIKNKNPAAFTVTDHGTVKACQRLSADFPHLTVLWGIEVTTQEGDFLVYTEDIDYISSLGIYETSVRDIKRDDHTAVIWAHPRISQLHVSAGQDIITNEISDVINYIDGLEFYNGTMLTLAAMGSVRPVYFERLQQIATIYDLTATGGSDAHDFSSLFSCFTRFPNNIQTAADMIDALKNSTVKPCLQSLQFKSLDIPVIKKRRIPSNS